MMVYYIVFQVLIRSAASVIALVNSSLVSPGLIHEFYKDAAGLAKMNLLELFPSSLDHYEIIETFTTPLQIKGFLYQRIRGWFLAPQTANYTFNSSCSVECLFYLSNTSDPKNKSLVIENNSLQNQLSSLIYLQENKKYYIEVTLSTISNYDLSVGVSITNGSNNQLFQLIPSNFFSLFWIETCLSSDCIKSPIKDCIFENGTYAICTCKNGQKIMSDTIACQDNTEIEQDSVFMEDEFPLARDTYVTTLKKVYKEYLVSFELKPIAFDQYWRSVIHLSANGSLKTYGYSVVYFALKNGSFHIASVINGSLHSVFYTNVLSLNKWTLVNVKQELVEAKNMSYQYSISVNGSVVYSTINSMALELANVKVYAGDPWSVAQNGYIRNLVIISGTYDSMFLSDELLLKNGTLLATLNVLYEEYAVTFEFMPTSFKVGYGNVIHITAGQNNVNYGDKNPAVYFIGLILSGTLSIDSSINGSVSSHFFSLTLIPLMQWTMIKVSQKYFNGSYKYSVSVNGKVEYLTVNAQPIKVLNAQVYASDPFSDSQPGSIRNLIVVSRSPGVWTKWMDWSNCSVSCTNSVRNRTRKCIVNIIGKSCLGNDTEFDNCISNFSYEGCNGSNTKTADCNTTGSAIWTQWGNWSNCTVSCGIGLMNRSRVCNSTCNMTSCLGDSTQNKSCFNNMSCEVIWARWSNWSSCNTPCGNGSMSRSRICNITNNFQICSDNSTETKICSTNISCEVNWLQWSNWSSCTVSCGNGSTTRSRLCDTKTNLYNCSGNSTEIRSCFNNISCDVVIWPQSNNWSHCVNGSAIKSQLCNGASNLADCLGNVTETSNSVSATYFEGIWLPLNDWSRCTPLPINATISRLQICSCSSSSQANSYNSTEIISNFCNNSIEVVLAQSNCLSSCVSRFENRSQLCNGSNSLQDCLNSNTETISCISNTSCEAVWAQWSDWSNCSTSCGNGSIIRSRLCNCANSWEVCNYKKTEIIACANDNFCKDLIVIWTQWTEWSGCNVSCGDGFMNRSRVCITENNMPNCSFIDIEATSCFANMSCVGEWSSWSECSETCGIGFKRSFFYDSLKVEKVYKTERCFLESCPVDAVWGTWGNFALCSKTCGGGVTFRNRSCENQWPSKENRFCFGISEDYQNCNDEICAVDGGWSEWSDWSLCSQPCLTGVQTRFRDCVNPAPQFNGAVCKRNAEETKACPSRYCKRVSLNLEYFLLKEEYDSQYSNPTNYLSSLLKEKIKTAIHNMYNTKNINVTFEIVLDSIKDGQKLFGHL